MVESVTSRRTGARARRPERYWLIAAALLLSGCGGEATVNAPPAATVAPAAIPRATIPAVAATPGALATGAATTAAAATVPPSAGVTAAAVIGRLQAAGLPIDTVTAYTAATDPNSLLGRPGQYASKAMFHDAGLPAGTDVGDGGSVETFTSGADLQARASYVGKVAQSSPLFGEYDYTAGAVLLRLSHALTPDQAAAYREALPGAAR